MFNVVSFDKKDICEENNVVDEMNEPECKPSYHNIGYYCDKIKSEFYPGNEWITNVVLWFQYTRTSFISSIQDRATNKSYDELIKIVDEGIEPSPDLIIYEHSISILEYMVENREIFSLNDIIWIYYCIMFLCRRTEEEVAGLLVIVSDVLAKQINLMDNLESDIGIQATVLYFIITNFFQH